MTRIFRFAISASMVVALIGCDQKPASATSRPTGGDGKMGKVPNDIPDTRPDDYNATLLLNDAYAAVDKKDFKLAAEKIAEVEKLKDVSPGIGVQVAEIRASISRDGANAATKPTP